MSWKLPMNDNYVVSQLKDKIDDLERIKRDLLDLGFHDNGFTIQAIDQVIDELLSVVRLISAKTLSP